MKHFFASVILLAVYLTPLHADEWKNLGSNQAVPATVQLIESTEGQSVVSFELKGFWIKPVPVNDYERHYSVSVEGASPLLDAGAPDLSKLTTSLHIGDMAHMELEVISTEYQDFHNILVAPSKGNLMRNINPSDVPFVFGPAYTQNAFYPLEIAGLREPFIIREKRGQTIVLTPFQYNPISQTLRVYTNIVVALKETHGEAQNVLSVKPSVQPEGKEFEYIYEHHFLNYTPDFSRYTPVSDRGNMLIIAHAPLMDAMQEFINWKVKSGMHVEMVDVSAIGNSAAIKQYVTNYYNENGLTFLLLVGDAEQVPPGFSFGDSDNFYSYIVGNDHYPDLFVGRFSAANVSELQTQIDRSIDYEMNPYVASNWFDTGIGIASQEGPGDNNEMDFEHNRVINDELLGFTYTYIHELYEGNQGGNDAPGNPSPALVAAAVNQGASIINYTGHGSQNSWGTSGFSSSDVNQLSNNGKLPFIWSVACVNGDFKGGTCFGESWLRATNNNEPSGAIGIMASTVNQSWNPPMAGQDEMNLILTEAYQNNIRRTFGGISMNGCMKMNDAYGAGGSDMTDTWVLFGDPSLMVRTANPQELVVTHQPTIFIGMNQFTINCAVEGAFAALSIDGQLLGTAEVVGGVAVINFEPIQLPGTANLVVTAFNYLPYMADLDVIPNEGAFVVCSGFTMNDENGNGQADYAENILLSLDMLNVGTDDALGVTVSIASDSEYLTIINDNENYGTIGSNETVTIPDGFAVYIAPETPDNTIIPISVTATDELDRSVWNSTISFKAYAPVITLTTVTVNDASGNNNGKLDPGETVMLQVGMINNGGAAAYNTISGLQSSNPWVSIDDEPVQVELMQSGVEHMMMFEVSAAPDTPQGDICLFEVATIADFNFSSTAGFSLILGQVPVLVLDLAGGESGESMLHCIEELNVGMDMMTAMPENLSLYRSVFVNLGVYPDNIVLSSALGQQFADYLDQGGNLYMEGGDTWAYDEQTAVHAYFGINGTVDGSGDLGMINGVQGTFTEGLSYTYSGTNSYIDQLAVGASTAFAIMRNQSPSYITAIANETDTYKTVGASFMFSGLTSDIETEQTAFMAQILNFFEIPFVWTSVDDSRIQMNKALVYPNPFADRLGISLHINSASQVSAQLFNVSGQIVSETGQKELTAGNHQIDWPSKDLQLLPAGIYVGKISVNGEIITTKVIKM